MNTSDEILPTPASVPRRTCHALLGSLLLFSLGGVPAVSASDVLFSSADYVIRDTTVTLSMNDIQNHSSNTTGTLRMELVAFNHPWPGQAGAVSGGYQVAVSPGFGPLAADAPFASSPLTETLPLLPPPEGTYYITLFLTENVGGAGDDGFEIVDYVNFTNTMNFGVVVAANGAFFGFSSAVSVGGGYYYDTDVGYLYSITNGVIYVSNLDRYFYVEPGTDFTTGTYIYDFSRNSFTYTEKSFWPYVYYFDGTGWVATGFN